MQTLIISLYISLIFLVFFILYGWKYKKHVELENATLLSREKATHAKRDFIKESKDSMKDKLLKISQIIAETEKYIEDDVSQKMKLVESRSESFETELIEKGGKEYRLTTAGLISALPKSKEELVNDLTNLAETIEKLEILDEEFEKEKKVDVGRGIFLEKMSRRFMKIIKENKLDDKDLIPIQQLKFHIFSSIKNLRDDDIFPIFNLMKETNLIQDVVEINPLFYFIIIKNLKFEFSNPEKVVLSFAYDHQDLTIEKLLELAQWDYQYAKKVITGLKNKGILEVVNDQIIINSFNDEAEKKAWNDSINAQIKIEKEQKELKEKRRMELKTKLRSQIEKVKKEVDEDLKEIIQAEEEPIKEQVAPKIKFDKKPSVQKLPQKEEKPELEGIESDDESIELNEAVSQRILRYHEKFSILNGGLAQFEKIENYILKKDPMIKKETIFATLKQLMELNLVSTSITLNGHEIFLFKEFKFTPEEKDFLSHALYKSPLTKDQFTKSLKWDEETTLKTMKKLQKKGIIRIEADKIIIPGIVQE